MLELVKKFVWWVVVVVGGGGLGWWWLWVVVVMGGVLTYSSVLLWSKLGLELRLGPSRTTRSLLAL
jgi:hypothetical protein